MLKINKKIYSYEDIMKAIALLENDDTILIAEKNCGVSFVMATPDGEISAGIFDDGYYKGISIHVGLNATNEYSLAVAVEYSEEREDKYKIYTYADANSDEPTHIEAMNVQEKMETFKIPVSWEVCDTVEVEAKSLEEAVKYVKDNIEDIPLGTEPEYIDGSYKIDDGDSGENSIEQTAEYLKEYWNGEHDEKI